MTYSRLGAGTAATLFLASLRSLNRRTNEVYRYVRSTGRDSLRKNRVHVPDAPSHLSPHRGAHRDKVGTPSPDL